MDGSLIMVYHGTSFARAQKILQTGIIRHDAPPIWESTTRGFVYVSIELGGACWAGKQATIRDPLHYVGLEDGRLPLGYPIVVFRWGVHPDDLLPDRDNQRIDQEWYRSTTAPNALSRHTRRLNRFVNLHHVSHASMALVNASNPIVTRSWESCGTPLLPEALTWIDFPLKYSSWIS